MPEPMCAPPPWMTDRWWFVTRTMKGPRSAYAEEDEGQEGPASVEVAGVVWIDGKGSALS